MLRTNTVFCCHRNEIISRLKEDFKYETQPPLTGPNGHYGCTLVQAVAMYITVLIGNRHFWTAGNKKKPQTNRHQTLHRR